MIDIPLIKIFLFGIPRLEMDGISRELSRRKALLLAYLALHPGVHAREKIATLFWGNVSDEAARVSLRVAISDLRKTLGDEGLISERNTLMLNPALPLWLDVIEFQKMADVQSAPDDWMSAVDLYNGDFLSDVYDDWAMEWRTRLNQLYIEVLLRLAGSHRSQADYLKAIQYARRVLVLEPANESAHQQIMVCFEAQGERSAALRQYEICAENLQELLGVQPSTETQAIFQRLQKAKLRTGSLTPRPTNLPALLTSFIGRETELETVENLLAPLKRGEQPARLVTLTGPGGSGKTRLSIQAAAELVDTFSDGVWWVELAALARPEDIARQIARVCGVNEIPSEPIESTLLTALQTRHLLLVLDNCEHLLEGCEKITRDILEACRQVQILATSRERLSVPGEQVYLVPTLNLPEGNETNLEAISKSDSVQLFVERARSVAPAFRLDASNASTVLRLCYRLDGLPLTIELAAARIRTISLPAMLEQISNRFDWLTRGERGLPVWRQTLWGVVEWSYNLLTEGERTLFQRLSVFSGGWTLEAAKAVCCDHQDCPPTVILNRMIGLAEKSLIVVLPDQDRYVLLETLREFGQKKLEESGELEGMHARHLNYFATWATRVAEMLEATPPPGLRPRVELENDNLRSALIWALEPLSDSERGLCLAASAGLIWLKYNHFKEGADWMERLLVRFEADGSRHDYAKLLSFDCALLYWRNQLPLARERGLRAIKLARSLAERKALANTLHFLGDLEREDGNINLASIYLNESVALCRELNYHSRLIRALTTQGFVLHVQGQYPQAQRVLEEALRLAAQIQDKWGESYALRVCAENLLREEHLPEALTAYQRALQSALSIDDKISVGITLANMAIAANLLEDYPASGDYAARALEVFEALGSEYQQPFPRRMMAYAALHAKDYARARALGLESLYGNLSVPHETGVLAALIALAENEAVAGNIPQAARLVAYVKYHLEKEGRALMRPDALALARLDKILPEHFSTDELADLQAQAAAWQLEQLLPG